MAHYIKLENVRLYCNHGCLPEEERIGSAYRVDLKVRADLTKSCLSDALSDTVDYVDLNTIVKEEMAIRSELLEHIGQRIITRIFKEHTVIEHIELAVTKINPPIGGDMDGVTVLFDQERTT